MVYGCARPRSGDWPPVRARGLGGAWRAPRPFNIDNDLTVPGAEREFTIIARYSFSGVIINKDTGESGQESGKPPEAPTVDDVSLHTTSRIFPDFLADTPLNKDIARKAIFPLAAFRRSNRGWKR